MPESAHHWHRLIDRCMLVDQPRLRRRVKRVGGRSAGDQTDTDSANVAAEALRRDVEDSRSRREARLAGRPTIRYADNLPVVQHREAIRKALLEHAVIVVCGETGSGKTTQLPKICLEAGRGTAGLIGHTQPRRLAARSVAARIAAELGSKVGEAVGFKIRFADQVSDESYLKLMTDGILLAEIQRDPWLMQYDTLIIDEAHERSLNIDFLLGYLKQLLPRRPDLKVIITSATIDTDRFAEHFGGAPVITAAGRNYPVEIRYAPPESVQDLPADADLADQVVLATEGLLAERRHDVLVFLSGEREIREVAELFEQRRRQLRVLRQVEILTLYSRLSNSEQNRIFQDHQRPRVILATNIAETSLTVPGIRAVVDAGLARISRYSVRSKLQRLPVERISQASANQRAGRCGRIAPGVCVRLYSEADFLSSREFTEPEILRTNLASVILQMASMRLGSIDRFPFIEAPEPKYINDGYRTLQELAALDAARRLTPLGRRLARLPIDPRLGRMLLAAVDEACLDEALTIVSALAIQDPRERPFEQREAADVLHAEFGHERSDFLAWLNLWSFVTVQREHLSNARFRNMCRQRYLSPLRLYEWFDVRQQLERLCRELKLPRNETPADYDNLHRALLAGLLVNIAVRTERRNYLGTRNRQLHLWPGSTLIDRAPKWVVAAEVVQTSRVYAREAAAIEPEWAERLADHLLKRSYREAHWQRKRGTVVAFEQSTLYGLVVNPKKRVDYTRINRAESHDIFIREALVAGGLRTQGDFLRHNLALLEAVGSLEEKSRRRDILVDTETLVRFYQAIVPQDVCTAVEFEHFRKRYEADHPRGLFFSRELLLADGAADPGTSDFPDQLDVGGLVLPLRYRFAPGEADDGVTLICPVEAVNRLPAGRLEWLVPGMLEEKLTALIKSLPKPVRRNFVPAPDFARAAGEAMQPDDVSLSSALSRQLLRMTGVEVTAADWHCDALPPHLLMRIVLIDADGREVAAERDLSALQTRFQGAIEQGLLRFSDNSIEREQVNRWNFGDLPEFVEIERTGVTMRGYPALEKNAEGVGIRLFASSAAAAAAMPIGVRALYRVVLHEEVKYLRRKLPGIDVLTLRFAPFGSKQQLLDDLLDAAIDAVFIDHEALPRTREAFEASLARGRAELIPCAQALTDCLDRIFEAHRQVARRIDGTLPLSWVEAVMDIRDQIAALLYPGFITSTGATRLPRLVVYFQGIDRRLDSIDKAPDRDRRRRAELLPVWERFKALDISPNDAPHWRRQAEALRWSFEELRISLFAQELKAAEKVSVSRLEERLARLLTDRPAASIAA